MSRLRDHRYSETISRFVIMPLAFCLLLANATGLNATVHLSNLENRFTDGGGVGDIGGVRNDWRPVTARFTAGAGSFTLNSVTLEFVVGTSDREYWTNASVRLSQGLGNEIVLLGSLKHPTVNPLPTQWPLPAAPAPGVYTTYVDFHPMEAMTLHGRSDYILEVYAPPISSNGLALVGTASSNYTSRGEWKMGQTIDPFGRRAPFLKLAVDADVVPEPPGYLLPGGITAHPSGVGPGAELVVNVIQNSTGDPTCFAFRPQGRDTFQFSTCLDEGVRAFLVSSNAPISLQAILEENYTELKASQVIKSDVPFYVGFYSGRAILTNGVPAFGLGIYTDPVFGWGKFVNQDDNLQMLDSALEYGGEGIYAGTRTIISVPESPALKFISSGNLLRLRWLMASMDFVLQQTSDPASGNWTEASSTATLNYTNFHYEVNVRKSAVHLFYRLALQ